MILEYLFFIDDFLPFFYSTVFMVCLWSFKRITSLALTAILLLVGEVFMNLLRDPLHALVNGSVSKEWGVILWTGTWVLSYLLIITIFSVMHNRLNIIKCRDTQVIIWMIIAASGLQILRYLSSITVQSELIGQVYQYGIPALNYCMGLFLLMATLKNIFRKKKHEITF